MSELPKVITISLTPEEMDYVYALYSVGVLNLMALNLHMDTGQKASDQRIKMEVALLQKLREIGEEKGADFMNQVQFKLQQAMQAVPGAYPVATVLGRV